jgi:hypothetical protein
MAALVVSCPGCGATAPADARWCPACGSRIADEVLPLESGDVAIVHGSGLRLAGLGGRRRAAVAAGLAALVIAGVAIGRNTSGNGPRTGVDGAPDPPAETTTTSHPPTTTTARPPIAVPPIDARLLLLQGVQASVLDLAADTISTRAIPEFGRPPQRFFYDESAGGFAVLGTEMVFQSEGGTFAASLAANGGTRLVAPGSLLFVASATPGRIWVVDPGSSTPVLVRELELGSRVTTAGPFPLPPDWTPTGSTAGGLVLTLSGRFQVWDPRSGRVSFDSGPDGAALIGVARDTVAWSRCSSPLCALHLLDVRTGSDRAVAVAPLNYGRLFVPFSPDGRMLAVVGFVQGKTTVAVVDVATQRITTAIDEVDSDQAFGLVWSADGAWLFVLRPNGNDLTAIRPDGTGQQELVLPGAVRSFEGAAAF